MGGAEGLGRANQSLGTVGGQTVTPKHPFQQPERQERGVHPGSGTGDGSRPDKQGQWTLGRKSSNSFDHVPFTCQCLDAPHDPTYYL